MARLSVVQHYAQVLAGHAAIEQTPDGYYATVPEVPGLVAIGPTPERCGENVVERLEQWTLESLERGAELPIVENIDLNTDENRRLASYHPRPAGGTPRRVFRDLAELDADLGVSAGSDAGQG